VTDVAGAAIVVEGLRKHYGKVEAVRNVSFAVARGTTMALLGGIDASLAAMVSREALRRAVDAVPESFLTGAFPAEDAARLRHAYEAFLWKRLRAPRPFV